MQPFWLNILPPSVHAKLQGRLTLQAIISNTSWLMVERLVNMAIQFFVAAWVVRYLGPAQYGVYSYALSFVALFAVIATLGLDNIAVRDFARGNHSKGDILGTVLALRLSAAVITMGLIAATILSVEDDVLTRIAVLIVTGQLLFQSANVFDLWFQAQMQSKYVVWTRSIVTLLISGSQIACILAGLPLTAFLAILLLQSVLTAVGLFIAFKLAGPTNVRWRIDFSLAKKMLRDAWPLLFAGLSISVYMRIDQVMLGAMIGPTAVGLYSAAVKVSELWYFIPTVLATSVFPKIVDMQASAPIAEYKERMQQLYDGLALFSYAIIFLVMLGAAPLIQVLFGQAYTESALILQVHIWALLFVSLGTARSKWLIAENMMLVALITTMTGAVVNVGLNIVLIPYFEGLGAAWATLFSYVVAAYASSVFFKSLRPVFAQLSKALLIPLRLPALLSKHPQAP